MKEKICMESIASQVIYFELDMNVNTQYLPFSRKSIKMTKNLMAFYSYFTLVLEDSKTHLSMLILSSFNG